jgi:hypothetical protein
MEILLIALGVILFGGMFLGLLLSYRDIEASRTKAAAAREGRKPAFYGWSARDGALTEELMLRQIEHHLRREAFLAEQFIRNPNPETLRAGEHSRLGAN